MEERSGFEPVLQLLGGASVLGCEPQGLIEIHLMLARGLPVEALVHLLDSLLTIKPSEVLETVVPISARAIRQRRKSRKRLNAHQTDAVWRLATILAQGGGAFGDRAEAELWLLRPATGFEQRRPIDLLVTDVGYQALRLHLARLAHGVYA